MDYQPQNTYIVKCSYPDYHFESEIGVFCDYDPNGNPPSDETLKKFFDVGEEPDIIEIIGACTNNFDGANLLSNEVIELINGGYRKEIANRSPSFELLFAEDWEDKKIFLSYIQYVYQQLPRDERTRHDYQQRIIQAVKDGIKCHSYQISREAVQFILDIFGIRLDDTSIPHQLGMLLDKGAENVKRQAILCKLTVNDKSTTEILRRQLLKLEKTYHLSYEDNQMRRACIFYKFLNTYPHLLPSVQGKLATGLELLSDFFGISTPQYRLGDILAYIDDDAEALVKSNPKLRSKVKTYTYVECLPLLNENYWRGLANC